MEEAITRWEEVKRQYEAGEKEAKRLSAQLWLKANKMQVNDVTLEKVLSLNGRRGTRSNLRKIGPGTVATDQGVVLALDALMFGNEGSPLSLNKGDRVYLERLRGVFAAQRGAARADAVLVARAQRSSIGCESDAGSPGHKTKKNFQCWSCRKIVSYNCSAKFFPTSFEILPRVHSVCMTFSVDERQAINREREAYNKCEAGKQEELPLLFDGQRKREDRRKMQAPKAESNGYVYCVPCEIWEVIGYFSTKTPTGKINRRCLSTKSTLVVMGLMCEYFEKLYAGIQGHPNAQFISDKIDDALEAFLADLMEEPYTTASLVSRTYVDIEVRIGNLMQHIKDEHPGVDAAVDSCSEEESTGCEDAAQEWDDFAEDAL